jgi:hypothetical protein
MGINNIDKQDLTFIFSIAKDPKTQEWGVKIEESYQHDYKKGIDLNIGSVTLLAVNKTDGCMMSATSQFNEVALRHKIASLVEEKTIDAAPYKKSLEALQAFKATGATEGREILRQENHFDIEGNILTGRRAVLHTVEKDAATGVEKASALAFKKRDLARYAFQVNNGQNKVWAAGFYYRALEKIGGKRGGSYQELMKPFTATPR